MEALQKLWKMFLFHLKSSFHSWDIQIFVFLSSTPFPPVSRCFRSWSKINLEVYNVVNCSNKNLIKQFAWYFEKEKRYDIKNFFIDRVFKSDSHLPKKFLYICFNESPFKMMKNAFLFHLKSSFRSQDI